MLFDKRLCKKIFFAFFIFNFFIVNSENKNFNINWSNSVSSDTVAGGWATWQAIRYSKNVLIPHPEYLSMVQNGQYVLLTINQFLGLSVKNHRLNLFPDVKKPKNAYPRHNRPRKKRDITSVKYFLKTRDELSPILIIRLHKNNNVSHVMLDGNHRLVAAYIKQSPIKVYFIDYYE